MKQYLTTTECAERLGMSRSTVHKLIEQGLLKVRQYSYGARATIRIPSDEIDRFLAEWSDDGDGSAARRHGG